MECAPDLMFFSLYLAVAAGMFSLSLSSCLSQGTVLITYAKQKFFLLMMPSVIWYAKRNEEEAKTIIFDFGE